MHSVAMKVVAAMAVLAITLPSAASHVVGIGKCKSLSSVQNFQPSQFTGLWYVIEIFSTTSDCMTMTFNETENGFTVTEAREFYLGRKVQLDHTFTNTGILTKSSSDPAKMTVRWPSNFLGSADVTIVDTDYTSFAVIYECQPLLFIHRASVAILSRTNTLDSAVVQTVKEDLAKSDLDMSDFDIIDHRTCNKVGEADFNWSIDDETFGNFGSGGDGGSFTGVNIPDILLPIEDVEIVEADPTENEVP